MLEDLREGRKEEYMSKVGLLILFERAGGKISEDLVDAAEDEVDKNLYHKELIDEVHELWEKWDVSCYERSSL